MDDQRLTGLLNKKLSGTLEPEEREELFVWLSLPEHRERFTAVASQLLQDHPEHNAYDPVRWEPILNSILVSDKLPRHSVYRMTWWKYAAVIAFLSGIGAYLWNTKTQKKETQTAQTHSVLMQNDVAPGSDKALLTLSNGQRVELNGKGRNQQTIKDGELAIKNTDGKLLYGHSAVVVNNTMSTPRGGQYQITLADSSRVWLNAVSSITYPTSFPGKTRVVTITGEAYFEVARNAKQPFIVKTNLDSITVIGTHFNVHDYAEEKQMKTTLLEGRVKINNIILKPGQAYSNRKVITTNTEQDIAWKNGLFNFQGKSLGEVMRQLSRWYDIDVFYEKDIPNIQFFGEMGRNLKLSDVLEVLTSAGVHFRLEANRRLVVLP